MQKNFKKLLSVIMTIVLVFVCLPTVSLTASAATATGTLGSDIKWSYDTSTKVLTVTGSGTMTNYSKAGDGQGYYKVVLGTFQVINTSATSIVIGEGITSIGNNAFRDFTAVTSITIPSTVTSIGNYAFAGCTSLKTITIPDNVTSIGNYAFDGCTSLATVNLSDSLTTIGNYAFRNAKFKSLDMPYLVTSIGTSAFASISGLTITCSYGDTAYNYCQSNSISTSIRTPSLAIGYSYNSTSKKMTVSLNLKDGSGFSAGNFVLTYDSSFMTPVSSTSTTTTSNGVTTAVVYNSSGKVSVAAMTQDSVTYSLCSIDGCTYTVATIEFTVKGSSNDSTVSVECSAMQFLGETITAPTKLSNATISKHNWDSGEVTTAATCSSTGVKTYTCTDCGATKTETIAIDASNHTGGTTVENAYAATCVDTGYTGDTVCLGCGATLSIGEEIEATGEHTYGDWTVVTAATTTSEGEEQRVCSVCGDVETRTIAVLDETTTAADDDDETTTAADDDDETTTAADDETTTVADDDDGDETTTAVAAETTTRKAAETTTRKSTTTTAAVIDYVEVSDDTVSIDDDSKQIILNPATSSDEFKAIVSNGVTITILSADGTELGSDDLVGTGCKIQVVDTSNTVLAEYDVIVLGDIDGNGKVAAADARLALRCAAKLDSLEGVYAVAADYDQNSSVKPSDARSILRKAAKLD